MMKPRMISGVLPQTDSMLVGRFLDGDLDATKGYQGAPAKDLGTQAGRLKD